MIATATDPRGADRRTSRSSPWVVEVVAQGRHEGDRRLARRACASTCASCRRSRTATCSSTSPARRSTTSRCARTRCAAGSRSPSTAITTVETGEVFTAARRGGAVRAPRLRVHPARAARERRRARGGARAASCRSSSSSATCAATCTAHSTWSDGKATLEEMVAAAAARGYEYLAICDHSHRLRDGRLAAAGEAIDALNEQLAPFRILKGIEVNIRADGELDVADEMLAPLDWVMASVHATLRQRPDRARPRGDGEPARRLHRPSRRAGSIGVARRRPTIDVERVVEKALGDGHVPRDQLAAGPARSPRRATRGSPARPGVKLVISSDGHSANALALRRARRGAGATGVADEGADREHAALEGDREAAQVTFRDDGAATVEWVASLPRAAARLAGARAGRSPGICARGCPRRRPSRPSRSPRCCATSTSCSCRR